MGALVGARHPNEYSDFLIKPVCKIYRELIEQEWPNIQRIMASLAQKNVTQVTIVRKLASYERQNQTKKALWELENICRTLYILDFIDDVTLRQTVQKALVAWQHINLFGTFEFSPSTSKVDIEALVIRYADPTYWHKAIQDEAELNLD